MSSSTSSSEFARTGAIAAAIALASCVVRSPPVHELGPTTAFSVNVDHLGYAARLSCPDGDSVTLIEEQRCVAWEYAQAERSVPHATRNTAWVADVVAGTHDDDFEHPRSWSEDPTEREIIEPTLPAEDADRQRVDERVCALPVVGVTLEIDVDGETVNVVTDDKGSATLPNGATWIRYDGLTWSASCGAAFERPILPEPTELEPQ